MVRIVKIRTWEDMEAEFGITDVEPGAIDCEAYFTTEMEEELPEDRIIKVKESRDPLDDWYNWNGWEISDDMVEEYLR